MNGWSIRIAQNTRIIETIEFSVSRVEQTKCHAEYTQNFESNNKNKSSIGENYTTFSVFCDKALIRLHDTAKHLVDRKW